ncbi:MAG: phenylacetate--CoA ligase [Deltaproteobacteria bacterium]|nr:phenylacetate--CoA ligase [Deltaproteobacteria bacterium]MBW2306195.1 phenylacetate--CoA ligase [Deltaproteobacteria bacterium]
MRIWDPDGESLERKELEHLQLERFQSTINRAYKNVSFYRGIFDKREIHPTRIQSLKDLTVLPFTVDEDLTENYPFGIFAVPLRDVVRIHTSMGNASVPVVVGYTRNDVKNWNELGCRALAAAGVTEEDIVQSCLDHGLADLGQQFQGAVERLGAAYISTSSVNAYKRAMVLQDYRVTVLISSPSYALHLGSIIQEMGIDPNTLSLKKALLIGEPLIEQVRARIEETLYIRASGLYSIHDVIPSIVAFECKQREGLHICEDHFIPEVVDPKTGEPVPPGELGELILTTVMTQAFPLIRYRTKNLTRLMPEACSCGRTLVRMAPLAGRTDQAAVVRGTLVNPDKIEMFLREVKMVRPNFLVFLDRERHLDVMEIWVEVRADMFSDEMKEMVMMIRRIQREIEETLLLPARIRLVEADTIREHLRNGNRIIDRRQDIL